MLPSGQTIVHVVKAEMGQHIGTALAQIVADELEIDWNKVTLDYPEGSAENFAAYGLAYTVNSGSVTTEFDRLSRAGAAGRIVLIEAGAALLGADAANCRARLGRVIDNDSGRSVSYADILARTRIDRTFAYPDDFRDLPRKAPEERRIVGQSAPALDVPEKTNGQRNTASTPSFPAWSTRRSPSPAPATSPGRSPSTTPKRGRFPVSSAP